MAQEPITFEELGRRTLAPDFYAGAQYYLLYSFSMRRPSAQNPETYFPVLWLCVNPGDSKRRSGSNTDFDFGVKDDYHSKFLNEDATDLSFNVLKVYDFDPAKLSDATALDDLVTIDARNVLVAPNRDAARTMHSWVADPKIRERILAYADLTKDPVARDNAKKYVALRKAPFTKSNFPGNDEYNYQGVKHEATKEYDEEENWSTGKRTIVQDPVRSRRFTLHDLTWLETFMKNKCIPIPR